MDNNGFLWGSATAAYQCEGGWQEGGKGLSKWDVFCHSEKNNVNPVTGDVSCDHYHRYEEDIRMMAEGGQNAYRFSLAWTRILPEGTGRISEEGISLYKRIIACCRSHGIEPLVTLYHYDLPCKLAEAGGWENRATVDAFAEYAKVCFEAFRGEVRYWATVNEPNYETLCCYAYGNYPPNVKDLERRWKAMYHIMLASARAVHLFRELGCEGMVGLVSDSYSVETLSDSPEYREAKRLADIFYNSSVNDVCVLGEYSDDYICHLRDTLGYDLSYMLEEDKAVFRAGRVDYLGVNAYCRYLVKPCSGGATSLAVNNTGDYNAKKQESQEVAGWFALDDDPSTEKNPWGMEIYPRSIYNLLMELRERYPGVPFIITENGLGGYDAPGEDGKIHDQYRIDYLAGFVHWIDEARRDGCDVRGYFVWSTMDLYSWINGYKKRYGLVYIDFDDENRRIPKDSYHWYKACIEAHRS